MNKKRDQTKEPIGIAKYHNTKYHVAAWRAVHVCQSVARAPIKDEEAEVKRSIKTGKLMSGRPVDRLTQDVMVPQLYQHPPRLREAVSEEVGAIQPIAGDEQVVMGD